MYKIYRKLSLSPEKIENRKRKRGENSKETKGRKSEHSVLKNENTVQK